MGERLKALFKIVYPWKTNARSNAGFLFLKYNKSKYALAQMLRKIQFCFS